MRPSPKNIESPFNIEDVFFSKTDAHGKIIYGNRVFYNIAKYSPKELRGKPHNIIRHPDIPRAVFYYLWDFIKHNKPFAGYVKNMAKDGSYYWVFAIVFPIIEHGKKSGYLSVRIKPTTKFFPIARELYHELQTIEQQEGMEISKKVLLQKIKDLGFTSYEEFMITALLEEFRSKEHYFQLSIDPDKLADIPRLKHIYEMAKVIEHIYSALKNRLYFFIDLGNELEKKFRDIFEITDELSLIALNSSVESHKIGSIGASFAVVSNEIKKDAERIGKHIVVLRKNTQKLYGLIQNTILHLLSLNIEIFAILYYLKETIEYDSCNEGECIDKLEDFVKVLQSSTMEVTKESNILKNHIEETLLFINKIERLIKELHYIQINGLIEASKLEDIKFTIIFQQVQNLVENTNKTLEEIAPSMNTALKYICDIEENIKEVDLYLKHLL
ncbi:aerotaxis receptor [Nitratiruptor sp. YY08-26]|uniref:methyl-accepting chemotaxis protein n=1 Tax=unclassified Nitratiruptor TaxID=2624044 RepID=UPI00191689ED|nr:MULTISPECIES: PAS domain-containing methyl-accepting chemotaxis protein [unclassified Nitratiruptor]BCD61300.1 aerotaxis receptor [Nitratiruptor sp. YY08-13]BCD65233.1 aerotaxis receptor [Nitratiruptor sp. YY08-26]